MSEQNKCWSTDNELFNYESLHDLLDSNDDLQVGRTVYVADAIPPNVKHLCDANDVIDTIGDRAFDIGGEYAEDCTNVSDEARADLNAFLSAWIEKHCNLNFYQVKNVKPYVLTAEDMEGRE